MNGLQHTSVSECVTHLWRKALSTSEMHRLVEYMALHDVTRAQFGFKNVAMNVLRVVAEKLVSRISLIKLVKPLYCALRRGVWR